MLKYYKNRNKCGIPVNNFDAGSKHMLMHTSTFSCQPTANNYTKIVKLDSIRKNTHINYFLILHTDCILVLTIPLIYDYILYIVIYPGPKWKVSSNHLFSVGVNNNPANNATTFYGHSPFKDFLWSIKISNGH